MKNSHLCKEDYDEVKSLLSMRQVAEYYGQRLQRGDTCLCPFHNDSRPSMKIYPNDKGFYCWACGTGGDVITFVGLLFDLNNKEACLKLIEDFSLPIKTENLTYREIREREKRHSQYLELQKFRKNAYYILNEYRKLLCNSAQRFSSLHFDEAMQELTIVEYRLECLKTCPEQYCKDRKAVKKLGEIERRITGWDEFS